MADMRDVGLALNMWLATYPSHLESYMPELNNRGERMYKFLDNEYKEAFEGRYYNANGFGLAIVASVTKGLDWAAYIGADNSNREERTLEFVLHLGCKLREKDARYYFPDIKLPYRT